MRHVLCACSSAQFVRWANFKVSAQFQCAGQWAEIHFGRLKSQILFFAWPCISSVSLYKLFDLPFALAHGK